MRLLECINDKFKLTNYYPTRDIPEYAILSHTWGQDTEEVTYKDLVDGTGEDKTGYEKIRFCSAQARQDGLRYFWVDTCCIDKSNNNELSTAINSMFCWYQNAARCYVYLSDISEDSRQSEVAWEKAFRTSRWFTRGWTLQELLAPAKVEFFTKEGRRLGDKRSLEQPIHEITGVAIPALQGKALATFDVEERFKWAETRQTTCEEDSAYCLLGIFGIFMPLIYGEGKAHAVRRLKKKIAGAMNRNGTPNNQGAIQKPWMVPFGRNEDFVGREPILKELLERTPPGRNKDDCQRTAIEGLGGVGKTQIAIEAAFRVRDEHSDCSIFWVPAVDATSFENAYREIGRQLNVKGIDDDKADVKVLVRAALSHESAGSWLLIIDNADDVELLFAGGAGLLDYLPFSLSGSVLFTTRNHEVGMKLGIPRRGIIKLAEMNRAEAVELLEKDLEDSQRDISNMMKLLDFLADLPLAIKQASAYMAKTGISTTKYLGYCLLSDKKLINLLSKDFEDRGRYKTIRNPIATTWLISFEQISRDNQLAASYLKFMCFLAEKGIPAALLPEADELDMDEAIAILKAFAFIVQREGEDSFDMHRLVRLAMQNWLEKEDYITGVIQRLAIVFPFPKHENRDMWMKYLPHGQAALHFRKDEDMAESHLLHNIAWAFNLLGRYEEAEQMYRQTLKLTEKILGQEHPGTLNSINNLAFVVNSLGRYREAEQMHRQTLKLMEKILGQEHPDTLSSMNNLALALDNLGRYEEAEQMHWQTLKLREKILGQEHPSTFSSILNLANVLNKLGRNEEAEQMYRQTLKLMEKILGQEHPDTLSSMNNLALALDNLGRYEEAEQMHRQTLELKENILGKTHPSTQISRHNLANCLKAKENTETLET